MKHVVFAIYILTTLYLILNTSHVFASLKLNEIYPAPSTGEYEWIELYNDENLTVDISQYQLLDLAGNKIKISTQSALPLDFVLATSSSVLNNSGDTISLKNNLGEIIEIATYSASFDPTKDYVKCPDGIGSWFVLNTLTKKTSNETACQILKPTPTLEPTLTITPTLTIVPTEGLEDPTPTITSTQQSYDNIFISEVMINPPTGEKEWLEIYNNNDFSVSLNNWFIDDLENSGSSPKTFSLDINVKSYGIFDLASSIFNNDGDSVRLLDANKNLKDDFEYQKTETGKTLGRTSFDSDNFCQQEPSKNYVNNLCINPTPTLTPTISKFQGLMNQTPTKNILQTKISMTTGQETRPLQYLSPVPYTQYAQSSNILGISTKINNNHSLIDLLCFLSTSYSLLTICSILFRMKLSYGKNKNFYSPPFHSS